jgi:hypothetical protein
VGPSRSLEKGLVLARKRQAFSFRHLDFHGDRLLVVVPLAVAYSVKENDRKVEILSVTGAAGRCAG